MNPVSPRLGGNYYPWHWIIFHYLVLLTFGPKWWPF